MVGIPVGIRNDALGDHRRDLYYLIVLTQFNGGINFCGVKYKVIIWIVAIFIEFLRSFCTG